MANDVTVDASEMVRLAVDIGKVAAATLPQVDAIAKRGAQNIKDDMVAGAEASKHFRPMGRTITYDRAYRLGFVGYDVGPDHARGGQAPLAGVAYEGGANGGGGTLDLDGPAEREEPRMMKALDELLREL